MLSDALSKREEREVMQFIAKEVLLEYLGHEVNERNVSLLVQLFDVFEKIAVTPERYQLEINLREH